MKKVSNKIIIFLIIINFIMLYVYFDGKIKMFYSPYHNFPVSWIDIENKEEFLNNYLDKLKQYELFKEAYKLDNNMIDKSLKNILLNNNYLDLKKISNNTSITQINFSNNNNYEGETNGYKTVIFDDLYKIDVNIYKQEPTVYYHELLHALFPWQDKKTNFLSESLVSIMVDESYKIDNNLYYNEKVITKMWIEILGVDIFKQMLVLGNTQPFENKLLKYNISINKIDDILNNMNLYHQELLKTNNLYNLYLDKCISDIEEVYLKITNNNIESNNVLKAYMMSIYKYGNNNYYVYLDSDNYKYFINYPNTTFYYYSDGINITKINLNE